MAAQELFYKIYLMTKK